MFKKVASDRPKEEKVKTKAKKKAYITVSITRHRPR